jgi:hypothetical protein
VRFNLVNETSALVTGLQVAGCKAMPAVLNKSAPITMWRLVVWQCDSLLLPFSISCVRLVLIVVALSYALKRRHPSTKTKEPQIPEHNTLYTYQHFHI